MTDMNLEQDFLLVDIMNNLSDFEPVNERICEIRVTVKYYNLTLISTHAPTEEKDEVAKEELYCSLEKVCNAVPNDNMKVVLGDFNAKVGKISFLYPACGGHRLHNGRRFTCDRNVVSTSKHSQGHLEITG